MIRNQMIGIEEISALNQREMSPSFFIPNIKLVGYGRNQSYQISCLKCGDSYFCLDLEKSFNDLFCDDCEAHEKYLKEENKSAYNFIGNIVGWEIKSSSIYKKRSHFNYLKVYKRDCYECQYCGYSFRNSSEFRPLHIDHLKPWSASGSNKMDNLVVACSICNTIACDKWFSCFNEKKEYIIKKRSKKRCYERFNEENQN